MANHKSAEKRIRQTEKRNEANRGYRAMVRTAVKKARAAADAGETDTAKELFIVAEKALASAASKGLYHPKNVSRKISRLAQAVNASK